MHNMYSDTKIDHVRKKYREPMAYIKKAINRGKIEPDDLATFISLVKQQGYNASVSGKGSKESDAIMRQYIEKLENSLKSMGKTGKAYDDAVSISREFYDTFDNPTLQHNIKRSGDKDAEVLDGMLTGSQGATTRKNLEAFGDRVPEADALIKDVIKANAIGNFRGTFKEEVLDTHKEILVRYPELRAMLENMAHTEDAVTKSASEVKSAIGETATARTAQESASKALEKEKGSALPKSAKGRKDKGLEAVESTKSKGESKLSKSKLAEAVKYPNATIKKILNPNSDYGTHEIKSLMEEVNKVEGGAEKFKRNLISQLTAGNVKSGAVDGKVLDTLEASADRLVDSGMFTRNEIDSLVEILDRTKLGSKRKAGKAGNLEQAKMSNLKNFMASAMGSFVAQKSPVGSALVLTGVMRKMMLGQMKFKGMETKASRALAHKLMANPKSLFNDDLIKYATTDAEMLEALNKLQGRSKALVKSGAIADSVNERDNKSGE